MDSKCSVNHRLPLEPSRHMYQQLWSAVQCAADSEWIQDHIQDHRSEAERVIQEVYVHSLHSIIILFMVPARAMHTVGYIFSHCGSEDNCREEINIVIMDSRVLNSRPMNSIIIILTYEQH